MVDLRTYFNSKMSEDIFTLIALFLLAILVIAAYFCPAIIAYKRNHTYKHVILGLNAIGFAGILPWIIAFAWAAWPSSKSLIDPIAGNITGKGTRNTGDTIGSVKYGLRRGYEEEEESQRN